MVDRQLTMFDLQQYNNDNTQGYYADIDALFPADDVEESVVNVSFNRKKSKLTFKYVNCGDLNSLCIGTQTFYRE